MRRALEPPLAALRRHPRHVLLAALAAGLLIGPRWPPAVPAVALLLGLALRPLALLLGALALLLAGAAVADLRLAALERSALATALPQAVAGERATLLEHPRRGAFDVRVAAASLRGERIVVRAPARVGWPQAVGPGVELVVAGQLVALRPADAHERRRGAQALLVAERIGVSGRRRGGLAGVLDGVRARSEHALGAGLPAAQGALARGMVLGQDDALTDAVRDDFRTTGLAHLVAASGANVLLLCTLVLTLGAVAGLSLSARVWLALALVAAYVPLAGGGPSIQRAGVMGVAGLLALLAGRPASRWYALLLAAALTLAWSPRSAEDPGWQLSFAAVVAMLALVPTLRRGLRRARVAPALAELVAITVAATIGTAPLIALHFERLAPVSVLANVLAAPAVAPVMWLGTIAAALGQLSPALAHPVAALAAFPLAYLTWLADVLAAWPRADVAVRSPGALGVVAIYGCAALGGLACARLARGRRARRAGRRVAVGIGIAGALAVGAWPAGPRPPDGLEVAFLDVGQGDATLIRHGSRAVLVDAGPAGGPLLDRLRRAGVRRLDLLVVTHDAADHGGGAAALLEALPVELVLDGEEATGPSPRLATLAAHHRVRRIASDAGQVVRVGPLELRVLWPRREPPAPAAAEPNDRATVIHLRSGAFDLLLTADAESDVLAALELPVVEALKVAHHGSDDPGLPALLARLRPQVAVISVGARNGYGHPTPATLAALRGVPVVRRTDRAGTVRLRLDGDRVAVDSHARP